MGWSGKFPLKNRKTEERTFDGQKRQRRYGVEHRAVLRSGGHREGDAMKALKG
jgi:hypothetical protein